MNDPIIRLAHGSGKGLDSLLHSVVLPSLVGNAGQLQLEDAAVITPGSERIAFTTDSFVVDPLQFSGGDIGKLAACGTINDLAMIGAVPRWMSVGLIIEEGLSPSLLSVLLNSLRTVCESAGVQVVCGDTKVVDHGKGDGLFINTSGIGVVPDGIALSVANAREGDAVIVSNSVGRHGIAILASRKNLGFASSVVSDCAPLAGICGLLLAGVRSVRTLRDATRGGVAAVVNEIARASGVSIQIEQELVPVAPDVKGACDFLGMDPLQVANEGTFIAIVPASDAERAVAILQSHEFGSAASIIGTVIKKGHFPAVLKTRIGGIRPLDVPSGELLPRIC